MKYTSKSKGGRPSKPTDEKRDRVVTIKLTDAEYFDLKERAKSAGRETLGVCPLQRIPSYYRQPPERN